MRATKPNLSILLVFMIFGGACGLIGSAQERQEEAQKQISPDTKEVTDKQESRLRDDTKWLDYWPAVVELEGKLTIKTFFGPPNFGENPETDSKEGSWILSLDKPINVRGKPDPDPGLTASAENVQELQLVLPKSHGELLGKKVIVKGTLFHAHTGHHHTDVLINVQSISLAVSD